MTPVVTSWREILMTQAREQPDALAYRFLDEHGEVAESLTYQQLLSRVEGIAAWLHQQGATGTPVLLLYPPGLEFICAFLGCLWVGAVAVPAYPPDPSRLNKSLPRLARIVQDCNAKLALTSPFFNWLIKAFALLPGAEMKALRSMRLQTTPKLKGDGHSLPPVADQALAFLQYTSGSTGQPKGVMLTHGQMLANTAAQHEKYPARPGDTSVFWLPVYHDMGLIGGVLQPLYMGISAVIMSPLHFLQQPMSWLKALARYRGVYTAAPNFALSLCSHRHDPYQLQGCDLSALKFLLLGGEPVRPETLQTFARTFAPYGFDARAFYPAYGLAEATVFVSGGAWFSGAVSHWVDGPALQQGQVVPVSADQAQAQGLVACGTPPSTGRVQIVDPESHIPLAPEAVGEIWVQGPYVAQGYWNQPELSAATFGATLAGEPGTWLRTGDLGYLDNQNQVVVTGRIKDLIILRGKNYYPQDLEWAVENQIAGVRKGCVAAFALPQSDTEALGIVAEIRTEVAPEARERLCREIAAALLAEYGIQPSEVALIAPRTLPKTTSGKLRRQATATGLRDGSLKLLHHCYLDAGAPELALAEELFSPDQTHQEVLRIWQEVMEVPSSELTDHFFQQGGDSLKALTLASELEERFQVELPIDGLMEDPTPAAIARYLQTQTPSLSRAPLPSLASDALIPLTPAQHQHQGQAFRAAWWLVGECDPEQVRTSLETLITREATLRTRYLEQGLPYQQIQPTAPLEWVCEALAERDPVALAQALPLPEVGLSAGLWTSPEKSFLALCWPAAHGDEASIALLQKSFRAIWEGNPTPISKGSLAQFASLAHTPRYRQGLSTHESWWRNQLAGPLPPLMLPEEPSSGGSHVCSLPEAQWAAFKSQAWEQRLTPATALLHHYLQLLGSLSGQKEVLVSLLATGRNDDRFRHSVGAFAQWLPLRYRGEEAADVHQAAMALQSHGDVPLSWLLPDLQAGPESFTGAAYSFTARDNVPPRSGHLRWERVPLRPHALPGHLYLEVWDGPTPQIYWHYSQRHSAAQIAAWAELLAARL
jgi:acyl-CoA synthetase (AMP-forming)/AMP-acid ligase II/acyl carrier protein